jgi:imidazole glycerol-phosphate synthase subunit HisH
VIAIIDYGLGNLKSIKNALNELGEESTITSDYKEIQAAAGLILPGVGAFGYAMRKIRELELDISIKDFVKKGKPILGICLGFQLLFEKSYEFGEFDGLGLVPGNVLPFPSFYNDTKLVVPHVGWEYVKVTKENKILKSNNQFLDGTIGQMYFTHSFYVECENSYSVSISEYIGFSFTSAINKENIYGVQFHPERSGPLGLVILKNFINCTKNLNLENK